MKNNPRIIILDYGVGNLNSIQRAFTSFGVTPFISGEVRDLQNIDAIVLPGVGSFAAGMRGLKVRGLITAIQQFAGQNKPILGICLGAQLLLTEGQEFGIFKGLNIIKGKVVRFPILEAGEKVPQIGWNTIYKNGNSWSDTVLDGINEQEQVYFVHSYILEPENKDNILALTRYGGHEFCSAMRQGNTFGCQFHPEKSGKIGLGIIEKFIKLAK